MQFYWHLQMIPIFIQTEYRTTHSWFQIELFYFRPHWLPVVGFSMD